MNPQPDPNAEQAALRNRERELSTLMTEKDRLLGIFKTGESLVDTFFQLEADGEMNLADQNAMKEAIAACMANFADWMQNFAAGHGNGGGGFAGV